ncbi:hypothetical protein Ahia01_000223300, partial [Argonauta hians]
TSCQYVDGMSSKKYIPRSAIEVSSNKRHVNALRPFQGGWASAHNDYSPMGNKPGDEVSIPQETKNQKVTLKFYSTKKCSIVVSISITACFEENQQRPERVPADLTTNIPTSKEVCVFDESTFMREFGYDGPHIIGWIEKDGIAGVSNETELVYINEKIEDSVVINMACTKCVCSIGQITCENNTCDGCAYGEWQGWSSCSKSCDNGYRVRVRTKHKSKGNEPCNSPLTETQDCNTQICYTETSWSSWSSWSPCIISRHQSISSSVRRRICHRGIYDECPGEAIQTLPCQSKDTKDKHCSGGQVWTKCSNRCPVTCLDAQREVCVESDECIPGCHCPLGQVLLMGQCVGVDKCPCYNIEGVPVLKNLKSSQTHPCRECTCSDHGKLVCQEKTDCCLWSSWSSWGSCSTSCGPGVTSRYKTLLGGSSTNCKTTEHESAACQEETCPPDCNINGRYYYNNDKTREDNCQVCYCRELAEKCEPLPFSNATAGWTTWTGWSECTQTCEGGIKYRLRYCTNPPPRCGAASCEGETLQEEPCQEDIPCFVGSNIKATKQACPGEFEIFTNEESCERTCDNRLDTNITKTCEKKSHCICETGYYKNSDNDCVPGKVCDVCHINGKVYQPGSMWEPADSCRICQCVASEAVCKEICPVPQCNNDEKLVYENNNCCPKCKHITENTCGLHKVWNYLQDSTKSCQSEDKINLTYCNGGCGQTGSYPLLTETYSGSTDNHCHCCEGIVAKIHQVVVQCVGEDRKKTMFYPEFWACKCRECK